MSGFQFRNWCSEIWSEGIKIDITCIMDAGNVLFLIKIKSLSQNHWEPVLVRRLRNNTCGISLFLCTCTCKERQMTEYFSITALVCPLRSRSTHPVAALWFDANAWQDEDSNGGVYGFCCMDPVQLRLQPKWPCTEGVGEVQSKWRNSLIKQRALGVLNGT